MIHFFKYILLIFIFASVNLNAQEYKYNIGLRGGYTGGITFRQFVNDNLGYEGILSFHNDVFQVTFLKEFFFNANFSHSDRFFLIKGYGAHLGVIRSDHFNYFGNVYYRKDKMVSPVIGIDGLLGIEYRMINVPLVFGLDWKPFFDFSTAEYFNFVFWDVGLSIKYSF